MRRNDRSCSAAKFSQASASATEQWSDPAWSTSARRSLRPVPSEQRRVPGVFSVRRLPAAGLRFGEAERTLGSMRASRFRVGVAVRPRTRVAAADAGMGSTGAGWSAAMPRAGDSADARSTVSARPGPARVYARPRPQRREARAAHPSRIRCQIARACSSRADGRLLGTSS
jgi:hypothetical protein